MVSHTRSVSSRSRSARNGGASSNRSNASHSASKPQNHGSHRANGPKKKQNKRKHLVLKWVLGIFAALLAAGIGLFAYMYITTEIPEPEKFALAEKINRLLCRRHYGNRQLRGAKPRNHRLCGTA